MATKLGSTTISKLYLGSTEITKAYLGSTEVYSSGAPVTNDAFELTIETTSPLESFLLPMQSVTSIDVDWGDGTVDTGITTDDPTHTYALPGTYSISVTGSAARVVFRNSGSQGKVRTVTNLGALGWISLQDAFRDCSNMTSFVAGDCNTSNVTSIAAAFFRCSSATTMDVSTLDTSSVTGSAFGLFEECPATTIDVSGFDTSGFTTISRMFQLCSSLENLDIDGWDVTSVTDGTNFLNNANNALTTAQYDAVLIAWAAQAVQSNVTIHFGDAQYTAGGAAEAARTSLITGDGWTITDGGAEFSPLSLFASSEEGAWYDPSDLTSLAQNSDGTGAVTVGDPVGYMADKSGNGNHATQATAASRPILRQTVGGEYYLEFDGVDDYFSTASIDFTSTDEMSIFGGWTRESNPAAGVKYEFSTTWTSSTGTFILSSDSSGNLDPGSRGTLTVQANDTTVQSVPSTYITSALSKISTDQLDLRVNGVLTSSLSANQGTGNYSSNPLFIGARSGPVFEFEGKIFGLIIRGKSSTTDEINQTEAYLADKSGVTL